MNKDDELRERALLREMALHDRATAEIQRDNSLDKDENLRYQALFRDKALHDESELKLIAQNKVLEKVYENLKAKGCSDDFIKDIINGSKCFDE